MCKKELDSYLLWFLKVTRNLKVKEKLNIKKILGSLMRNVPGMPKFQSCRLNGVARIEK